MDILSQSSTQVILFFVFYGITGAVPLMVAIYLLFRRGNAFAPHVMPPLRLRRWTASFFAFSALAHVWWLLFFIYSCDMESVCFKVIVMLDCVLLLSTIAGIMLSMLQDRRRPVWPVLVAMIPFVVLSGIYIAHPCQLFALVTTIYILLICGLFSGYMVVAIRQYGRWLNDNYADLENKKVWLSQVVAFLCVLLLALYILSEEIVLTCLLHVVDLMLVVLLLWRVETLPTLEEPTTVQEPSASLAPEEGSGGEMLIKMEQLLQEHCLAPQLYLQVDLTLQQLAVAIGTNRTYLSQYFASQGITYNVYINNLRINHFIRRYQAAAHARRTIVAQKLAQESGYRSYSTFSLAFKQRMGQTFTDWMNQSAQCKSEEFDS